MTIIQDSENDLHPNPYSLQKQLPNPIRVGPFPILDIIYETLIAG